MKSVFCLASVGMLIFLAGCGLDGVSGRLLKIDGSSYVVRTPTGEEHWLHVDPHTRKDRVSPGDDIHAYVSKDGRAEFIQRVD